MRVFSRVFGLMAIGLVSFLGAHSQTVLIDHHFNVNTLPDGVTSNGAISPTKSADGVCTQGMIQVNSGQFFQVDVAGCESFIINAKSTSSSARVVTVKYKKRYEPGFTTLAPTISIQAASVFNLTTQFPVLVTNDSISIRIEPAGNIQIHDLYVTKSSGVSTDAAITAFKINGQLSAEQIFPGNDSISIDLQIGTDVTAITPQQVIVSPNAIISPAANTPQNFTNVVVYTVTAQDGITVRNWKVKVNLIASSAKDITAFQLAASQIGSSVINPAAGTILVTMPQGTPVNALAPLQMNLSPFATVSPIAGAIRDFTNPVNYTVTAQDASTKVWTVTVQFIDPNATFTDYQAEDAQFTGKVDNAHAGYSGTGFIDFLSTGDNFILFNACLQEAGVRTLKFRYSLGKVEVRTAQLFINDVNIGPVAFPSTPNFTTWVEVSQNVALLQGLNKIKLVWDSTDGPNLDKMSVTGQQCNAYTLNVSSTNGGMVAINPVRGNGKYFEGETITLFANTGSGIQFTGWSGDTTSTSNPLVFDMYKNRTITADYAIVQMYTLTVNVNGIGEVTRNPTGTQFPLNTMVDLQAIPLLSSTFTGWTGDASGTNPNISVQMTGNKTVTANFSGSYTPDFNNVVGFAAIAGDGFAGPTIGGGAAPDTLFINGPAEFNKLCEAMYYRGRAYKNNSVENGYRKVPMVVILRAGTYDGTQSLSSAGSNAFGNAMLDIPEQGDITFLGDCNVVFKIGINVKRSYNVLIRNISFYDYDDDAINVGYPQTHHVWIDHCSFGNPNGLPSSKDTPDGTSDIKDGASYVTISWCKYQNHWKTSLVGHSDNNGGTDAGRLKVTYYANYFVNTNSRTPRVRFGEVHVLNNMYENAGLGRSGQLGYGIAASNNSSVYAEGNYFLDTRWPMFADRPSADFTAVYGPGLESPTGNKLCFGLRQVDNVFNDAGLTASLVGKVNANMLNPSGLSIKFDSLIGPNFSLNPASYYNYSSYLLPAEAVRVIVPLFAGADKIAGSGNCILPLNLTYFHGKSAKEGDALEWKTSQESNMDHFGVQYSTDGIRFVNVGEVAAKNTSGVNQYNWFHRQILPSVRYYRLAMADRDGHTRFSNIIQINELISGEFKILQQSSVQLMLQVPAAEGKSGTISLISADGRKLKDQVVPVASNQVQVNITGLTKGTYWMVLQQNGKRKQVAFTHQ